CGLCGKVDEDSGILGQKYKINGMSFHTYCALFANGLCHRGEDDRIVGSFNQDLIRTAERARKTVRTTLHCLWQDGGFCAHTGCDRSFHLPCASEGECVTQYFQRLR
ncbi:UNVERIFIED_CONTAM: hypothetical protein H355_005530, partial [Colinus virginianus]